MTTLANLAGEVSISFVRLFECKERWQDIPVAAFAARGLLELLVWCRYCTGSRDQARRFYEDKFHDGMELYDSLGKLAEGQERQPGVLEALSAAKRRLQSLAALNGVSAPGGASHLRVSSIADTLGLGDVWQLNRVLSKFAHPTAMIALSSPDHSGSKALVNFFQLTGIVFATESLRLIAKFFEPVA